MTVTVSMASRSTHAGWAPSCKCRCGGNTSRSGCFPLLFGTNNYLGTTSLGHLDFVRDSKLFDEILVDNAEETMKAITCKMKWYPLSLSVFVQPWRSLDGFVSSAIHKDTPDFLYICQIYSNRCQHLHSLYSRGRQ